MVLIKFENSHEKVAMDLLSFMSSEQKLNVLQHTIRLYEEDPNWHLYFWKVDEDFVGAIGIELNEHTFNVHHASVHPAFRNEGIGHIMVEHVQRLHEPLAMSATPETKDFLAKCWEHQFSG